ncbi:MAG: hypothetical protein CSA36_08805 [Draconibacterium sp.]|nr:MAG: hypothetical protein CSA36_08805 [Draconibacterium sp.]
MKKSILRVFVVIVLPLALIAGINYGIDPDYLLNRHYIKPLAKELLSGKMVEGPINVNSRMLKKVWMQNMKTPEILILGSSRTLGLSQVTYPGKSFFNASVTNCSISDMYGFIGVCIEKGNFPLEVIICADQWLLGNRFVGQNQFDLRAEIAIADNAIDGKSRNRIKMKQEYFKEKLIQLFSVKYMLRALKIRGKSGLFQVADTVVTGKMMFFPDGSRGLPAEMENRTVEAVRKRAISYFYLSNDEKFVNIEAEKVEQMDRLLGYLKKKNCHVWLYIPPYHPRTWSLLQASDQHAGVFKTDEAYKRLAEKYGFSVVGASNPEVLSLTENDFYDGVHLKSKSLNRYFLKN